jgi:hypothetical protein
MDQATHNKIVSFIWGIADDVLTVAEETLTGIAAKRGLQISSLLYGQEFDFMLANPPYGKSRKKDLEAMGGKDGMRDPRFKVMHRGEELSLVTRSSDGQLLFLVNMASTMNHSSTLGSRIAEVHNGSSLFTGDAGQGESNIRRWIIENDWLEAIVALPLSLFYNTGIATYVWVLSNRKPAHRQGKVQLIDASQWFRPLRKNLGKKNCELAPEDIERISRTFLEFKETPESKIFPNAAFGYWKVTVGRPLRLHSQLSWKAIETLRFASGEEDLRSSLYEEFGDDLFSKLAKILAAVEKRLDDWGGDEDEGDEEAGGSRRRRQSSPRCTSPARPRLIRSAGCSKFPLSMERALGVQAGCASWSTSPTPTCGIPSRCRCWKRAASKPSYAGRCCPTRRTRGSRKGRPRSAMRSASRGTSISRSRCGRWRRSAPTFWLSRRRRRV